MSVVSTSDVPIGGVSIANHPLPAADWHRARGIYHIKKEQPGAGRTALGISFAVTGGG
jgi:hypothetical protein